MMAADFPGLVDEYLLDLHSRHPMLAAASGLHAWDSQLEDFSPLAVRDEIAAIKRFEVRLLKIHPLSLSSSDLIDYQIIASNMKARLLELEQVRSFEKNPSIYSDIIATSLLQTVMFEYAPLDSRLRHVLAKEKLIPRLLDAARLNIGAVPAPFLKMARENFKATLNFLRNDVPAAFADVKDVTLQGELQKTTKKAAAELQKYINQLEKMKPHANATFALGKQNFEARLRYEEGIEVSSDTLLKVAYRELAATREAFRKAAGKINPREDAMRVWTAVQREHPRAGTLVVEARRQLDDILRFLIEKRLVTLPESEPPAVAATPEFMRWATASMWTPGPFESRKIRSRYLITDVSPAWNEQQKEEYLASLNYPQLWATSIHEAYPGHFLQGIFLRQVQSKIRKTAALAPASFVEGWAHYAEQMMIEQGFKREDPKIELGQLADALLRICRFVVAIRLHTGGMSVEEAGQFFIANAYLGETPARTEAERGTFDATYLVYTVGKLAILKMREDYRRLHREDFSLQEFHDRLLANGQAPLWAHRQMLMPGDRSKLIE